MMVTRAENGRVVTDYLLFAVSGDSGKRLINTQNLVVLISDGDGFMSVECGGGNAQISRTFFYADEYRS